MNTVTIRPGHNAWLLARTDRDGASESQVRDTAAAFLNRVLPQRGVFAPEESWAGPATASRYYIGSARPVDITASQQRPKLPGGDKQRWESALDEPVAVNASVPWYVLAEFDWRAGTTELPWPMRAVNDLGFPHDDKTRLDWLLLEAKHASDKPAAPDSNWYRDAAHKGGEVAKQVLNTGLLIAVAVFAGFLLVQSKGER